MMVLFRQVPCYYTDRQRRAMLDAVSMAGLNCLRLMNDTSAGKYVSTCILHITSSQIQVCTSHVYPNMSTMYNNHPGI